MTSAQAIIQKLHSAEVCQQENLMALLGAVKGSKIQGPESQLPSMARGLYTSNQKLLQMASQCMADLNSAGQDMEVFKSFVNDFIIWFDANFVIFEKLHSCLSVDHITEGQVYQKPALHCSHYVDFAVSATKMVRNPFVIEKLGEFRTRASALIDRNSDIIRKAQLNDISFDHVQTFGGRSVSCFFTPEQIVRRTENASLFMGKSKVEMLLLNLSQRPSPVFDSLVILRIPATREKRSVIYPPFRVNELSISLSYNCINFSSFSLDQNAGQNFFAVTGSEKLVEEWFQHLKAIFPTDEKLLQSSTVKSHGLGIETVSESSDDDYQPSPNTSQESQDWQASSTLPKEPRRSLDSCHSFEIMKKSLSNNGIEPEDKEKQLQVVEAPEQHRSITAEYAYPDDADADLLSVVDSIECFDIVTKPAKNGLVMSKDATASLPNLSSVGVSSIYINAAGSAIDVNNFGQNHNPSFASLPPAEQKRVTKKKSFLDLFRKKKEEKPGQKEVGATEKPTEEEHTPSKATQTSTQKSTTKPANSAANSRDKPAATMKKNPDLQIEIPKISAFDANFSQPNSATSASNRTLPSPFALPSSTSTYFFKPYLNGSSEMIQSSTSLVGSPEEQAYAIPQDFKDIVNADDTLDFYITPSAPNSIKVSRWKNHYGKWELLTANENVFLKIVANYNIHKSWLLVFKEEYDEEYGEVIDKPLLVLDLDEDTSARQSTALDVEIHAVDAFSKHKNHIIVRCYNRTLVQEISTNLSNILEVMESKKTLRQSSNFESSATLSSSLMSKPSTSSTLTSIFTQVDQKHTPASSIYKNFDSNQETLNVPGTKLLLDRMTIKLHQQMESYEQIHKASSWKSLSMYSLSISHSVDSAQVGFYHFDMNTNEGAGEGLEEHSWSFKDDEIHEHIERIGKAAMLVKSSRSDIFMLECRGKKELKRLINLF